MLTPNEIKSRIGNGRIIGIHSSNKSDATCRVINAAQTPVNKLRARSHSINFVIFQFPTNVKITMKDEVDYTFLCYGNKVTRNTTSKCLKLFLTILS